MVYVSRKMLYPAFIVAFTIVFFTIVYFLSFSQSLLVESSRVELDGESLVFYAKITNTSNNYVKNITIDLVQLESQNSYKVKDLAPGESVDVEIKGILFSSDLKYDVFVLAPFNKTIKLSFTLDESTIRPVTAEVTLAKNMKVNGKYDYLVKICNISNTVLNDVLWTATVSSSYFEENFIPQTIDLSINQCKNLNSTLTPIRPGNIKINFNLKVGKLEQNYSQDLVITE